MSSAAVICTESDRKSTRLNSSHLVISYAVFCLKTKKAIAILPRVRQTLAPRAQAKTGEHPHQNTRAEMGLGQLRLYFFPRVCRCASCARASIYACLACNTVSAPGATLRTKSDSKERQRSLRTEKRRTDN